MKNSRLQKYVGSGQVLTSSELIQMLVSEGETEVNARKILSRHSNSNGLWRSENLRLSRGERLYAESTGVGSAQFFAAAGKKLDQTSRNGFARCVAELARHPVLHRLNAVRLLAVPTISPGSIRLKDLYLRDLQGLQELGAHVLFVGTALESIVAPRASNGLDVGEHAARQAQQLRHEALLTRLLLDHLRRQNMISWNCVEYPDLDKPFSIFNDHVFSGHAFSFLKPLVRWDVGQRKLISCPILVDCYHEGCTIPQVNSFLARIDGATIRGSNRLNCLGIIAAPTFEKAAWSKARNSGLMTVNFRQLFGDEALEAMVQVEMLLSGLRSDTTAELGQERFTEITELLSELKSNPIVVDLRSIGFEALSALILRTQGYEVVELGRVVPWKNTSRDVDVFAVKGDELRVIECKAYHRNKSVKPEDVRKFFTETLPALKNWLRQNSQFFSSCVAEIWTTGPKGKAAGDTLHKLGRPPGDSWAIVRMSDMYSAIPRRIQKRSIRFLETVSMAESSFDDDVSPED